VTGIGTNLNCLNGVMPSEDKLIHLILYKKLIEATFNVKIPWVTGGTSVVFPLFMQKRLPKGINHFRIGETLFFGNDLIHNNYFQSMKQGVFKLKAEILEINLKPKVPVGELEANPSGEYSEINENDYGKTSFRAIVDIGVLDIATTNFLKPIDKHIEIVGASSDMVVLDMGDTKGNYKVGDYIEFEVSYMGILRLMNSFYIEKEVINPI
jgi:predicted amino acid racemase